MTFAEDKKRLKKVVAGYIASVRDGSIVAGVFVRRAVERHLWDLDNPNALRCKHDADAAVRVIRFFGLLRHWKGEWAGTPIDLQPWQVFILWCLFGWKRADGTRRFRMAHIEVARKNGKTTFLGGICLYLLTADGEMGGEIYTAATKKEQARIVLKDAVMMVRQSPALKQQVHISGGQYENNIAHAASASKIQVLASDSETQDALNVSAAAVDELHALPDCSLWDVLQSATGARRQPLMAGITTAGNSQACLGWRQHDLAAQVLDGFDKPDGIRDDTLFAFIAAPDKDDDPYDKKTWEKGNPNLGVSQKLADLEEKAQRAKQFASFRPEFFQKHLNLWANAAGTWIDGAQWDACRRQFTLADCADWECMAGVDLAARNDVTALVLTFRRGKTIRLLPWFWIPEVIAAERRRLSPIWAQFLDEGLIETTPGATTDFEFLENRIVEFGGATLLPAGEIVFDPHNSMQTATRLRDTHGFQVREFAQTFPNFNEPCREFERMIVAGELEHNGNAVLRWMVSNMALLTNSLNLVKPGKRSVEEKTDGGVAAVMGVAPFVVGSDADAGELTDIPFVVAGA